MHYVVHYVMAHQAWEELRVSAAGRGNVDVEVAELELHPYGVEAQQLDAVHDGRKVIRQPPLAPAADDVTSYVTMTKNHEHYAALVAGGQEDAAIVLVKQLELPSSVFLAVCQKPHHRLT
jgi:hypothetical protein